MYEKHFFILPKSILKQNGDVIPVGLFLTVENNWISSSSSIHINCPTNTGAVKEVSEFWITLNYVY